MGTKIEWANMTLNPIIGCKKISDGKEWLQYPETD